MLAYISGYGVGLVSSRAFCKTCVRDQLTAPKHQDGGAGGEQPRAQSGNSPSSRQIRHAAGQGR